jgi:hypothetical protein
LWSNMNCYQLLVANLEAFNVYLFSVEC